MNRKPPPTDADVRDLAKRLKALWSSGQSVRPFLRQQADPFRELQSQGWSWAGLALAMNKAKITYRTGKPWTADSLVQAFSRAQAPLKPREITVLAQPHEHDKHPTNLTDVSEGAQLSARAGEPMSAAVAMSFSAPANVQPEPLPQISSEAEEEPEFKLARFIDWDERRRVAERTREARQQADAPTVSAHYLVHNQHYREVMEYLTGKKPPL